MSTCDTRGNLGLRHQYSAELGTRCILELIIKSIVLGLRQDCDKGKWKEAW